MLRLKVQGKYLNLPEDIEISIIVENPMFLTDRIPVPNTLSFELDPTKTNLEVLGYPNRITSIKAFRTYTDSQLEFGPSVLLNGTFIVTGFDETIRCQMVGVILSETTKKPANELDLDQYDFGPGNAFVVDSDNPDHMAYWYRKLVNDSLAGDEQFVACPVRIKNEPWPYLGPNEVPTSYGFYATSKQYFNFYNARLNSYMLGDERHSVIFPQPFVKVLLNAVFGSTLATNPFSAGDLAKLVLVTSYHPRFADYDGLYINVVLIDDYIDNYLRLNSFLPTTPFNEIVKELLKLFCATMFFISGKIHIVLNKEVIDSDHCENWTGRLTGRLATSKEESQVYNYGYADHKEEAVSTVAGLTELETLQDLIAVAGVTEEAVSYYITSINQVFSKRLLPKANSFDPDRWVYELVRANYGGVTGGSSAFQMISNISPLPMNIENYWWENNPGYQQWFVPVWTGDRLIRPEKAYIMMYTGKNETFVPGDEYPFLTSHNIDHLGERVSDTSLHFDGPDGLLENYHSSFKSWVEREKIRASGIFQLSATDLRNLDLRTKKHINGKLFYIEKVSVSIRKNSVELSQVDLIEA